MASIVGCSIPAGGAKRKCSGLVVDEVAGAPGSASALLMITDRKRLVKSGSRVVVVCNGQVAGYCVQLVRYDGEVLGWSRLRTGEDVGPVAGVAGENWLG